MANQNAYRKEEVIFLKTFIKMSYFNRIINSKLILNINSLNLLSKTASLRNFATKKRFYRKTGILYNDGKYEVTLDQRKLKTPNGNLFTVESEPLALAVATEWDGQGSVIQQNDMHLTMLCNTVIDNPTKLTKYDLTNYIVNYLETDTILYQSYENEELYKLQVKEWDPVIQWFCDRFQVDLKKCRDISIPKVSEEAKAILSRHFMSHNFNTVHGYIYGIDTLNSVILTVACAERFISPERAVLLARLEEEFQLGYWGRVEWAHDLSQQNLQARIAATILFVHFNSSSWLKQSKQQI